MSRFLTKILNEKPGENKPKLEVVPKVDHTQTISTPNPIPDHSQTNAISSKSIAPDRDFNKRANILEREALPNGLFPGASKAIYDALYLRTLGSINPKRTVQATRKELMKWSGIKNIKTINVHIKRLKDLGLIRITNFMGEQTGSHYEVFLPKEDNPDQTQTTQTKGKPEVNQKMDSDQDQKMVWVGLGKAVENKAIYEHPNTSLKTNTRNDDEAFASFIGKFQKACERLTGRQLSKRDADKLNDLADLLILQLDTAARKTKNISDVPAFLTEVLRRQFFASRQQPFNKSAKTKIDTVGKSEAGTYEIKPLDAKGREEALAQLREFAADDFLGDFKKWYTTDDWTWLMNNLGISDSNRSVGRTII
jgi:hypothetical protein